MTRTIRQRIALVVAFLFVLLTCGLAGASAAKATDREHGHTPVTICHKGRTITVDDDAVPAHLAHGDDVGACAPCPDPTVEPTPDPTPSETPTEEPTEEPTDEPTVEPTPDPTPTDEPTTEPTPAGPEIEPTIPATVPPVTTPPAPVAAPVPVVAEVHTVATPNDAQLAETGLNARQGLLIAAAVILSGVALTVYAARRRARA